MKLQMENPQRQKEKVYIGCGAGFGGDQPVAALKLLQRVKELDYLVLECLAERTLADRYQAMKSGGKGYDPCKVITSAEFYPIYCNILAYSSSKGSIHLVDIWQSVLCDSHSKLAPELLLGAEQYSTVIDTWSLGRIMVEMLSKEPLFNGKTEVDQIDKIFRILGTPNETIWEGFSELPGVKVNFVKHPCIGCDNRRDISMGTVVVSMKTGDRYSQIVEEHAMKYKEKHPNLDLKPNRSSPPWVISMERSSPSSSCVSREPSPDEEFSKKTAMSMMLMGCPGCLMYVIISEENPKCPRCKSTVLLDFFKEERIKNSKT
ncbi:Cyclin-dependent kinase G-2 [Capsicum chinense]|nr:Cyclin-dependent kinase G-2 [Capsicum chinense]